MRIIKSDSGQSVIETALTIPFTLFMLFNALNVGYYWAVSLKLATAPRQGIEYSITGSTTTFQQPAPDVSQVTALIDNNVTNAIGSSATTPLRACTVDQGMTGTGATQVSECVTNGALKSSYPQYADPEAPTMILNQVDIEYQVAPLIPGAAFNLVTPPLLHKTVVMRAMP